MISALTFRRQLSEYRACSWREKRQVLDTFWRRRPPPSPRLALASYQYGRLAQLSILIIAIEVALIAVALLSRGVSLGILAGVLELFVLVALWWTVKCEAWQRLARESTDGELRTS